MSAAFYVTSKIHPGQKCRVHAWFDTKKLIEKFGIQAKVGNRYCHVIKDNTPWLFESRPEALAAIASHSLPPPQAKAAKPAGGTPPSMPAGTNSEAQP